MVLVNPNDVDLIYFVPLPHENLLAFPYIIEDGASVPLTISAFR